MSQEYFGDDDKTKEKLADMTIGGITNIEKPNALSDIDGILSKAGDGNETIDDIAMNMENPKNRVYRVGKPTKVADINAVMGKSRTYFKSRQPLLNMQI